MARTSTRRRSNRSTFRGDFDQAANNHGLSYDPMFNSRSMRHHLEEIAQDPRAKKAHWSDKEWFEFAGFWPNTVKNLSGTNRRGAYPGVRVDVLEGYTAHSQYEVEIDGTRKALYLVWLKGGRRFMLVGPLSSMRTLARDFEKLGEPVMLTKVDYVAPRYPVPAGVRRTKTNREMSIAFTHKVENPTQVKWNGQTDPAKARFDISIKAPSRRWVDRSGLTF